MFKVRIIPCLDVKDGRVVKGVNFVNLRDAGDPVEAAIAYDAAGADELCFLDITASHENRDTIYDVVTRTAEACFMPLTVGGGVRTVDDIRRLLTCGADKVSINTAAVVRRAREVLGTLEGEHRMVPGPQPAPPDPEQLDLLGHAAIPHPLLERLRELDLDSLTPIQAIVRLAEMQKEARG